MDIIFKSSYADNTPSEDIRNRIKAKAALYTFMGEIASEILDAYTEDLIAEFIRTCIRLLHPFFTGAEIMEEAKLLIVTLKLPVPENYSGLFADSFQTIMVGKLKASLKK